MALVNLINVPKTPEDWEIFSFSNREQINALRKAIFDQRNINLPEYEIYPISFNDFNSWLQRNQQAHSDINSALGLQGSDIEELDPKNEQQLQAWTFLQYQELYSASASLKI